MITSTDGIDAPFLPVTASVDALLTPEIHKPARYLGNERGAVHKPWEQTTVRWVLTYPEVYEVGASNLGHIILYGILNAQPRQLCDRAYLPAADLAEKLQTTQTPLFAVESRRTLTEEIKTVVGRGEMVTARGEVLPLYRLHRLFNVPAEHINPTEGLVVILEHQMKRIGLLVDALDQQQQVVMKSLEANYAKVDGIAGATILGDGKVALIVDVAALTEMNY